MKVYIERNDEGTFSIYDASTNSEVEHGHFNRREAAHAYCWLRGWIVVD